ncbi:SRPBCC family protein [Agrococcus sp. HG114]|uniref:SRPBCC family protein n=1 Tax=Agrococcus sp. HG114 TaxID=2969757 RepID=UPI00215B279B|nr:SRPBCC family protein [Agrococcus sp. HG114]MCR8670073.1 SRPBCC family protein [Agrococcus sp. HG114]
MRRAHYRFEHSWLVDAGADAVLALLEDVGGYGRWWPGVRATGSRAAPGAREAALVVRAPLGYRIRFALREAGRTADELRATMSGDLAGSCSWRVRPEAGGTRVHFEQEVEAKAPLLRLASLLLHRALAAQHALVMRRAARGMRRALADSRSSGNRGMVAGWLTASSSGTHPGRPTAHSSRSASAPSSSRQSPPASPAPRSSTPSSTGPTSPGCTST